MASDVSVVVAAGAFLVALLGVLGSAFARGFLGLMVESTAEVFGLAGDFLGFFSGGAASLVAVASLAALRFLAGLLGVASLAVLRVVFAGLLGAFFGGLLSGLAVLLGAMTQ